MSEFELIRRIRDRLEAVASGPPNGMVVSNGDDAAVLEVPPGWQLVVCTDTLVEGVHFPANTAAKSIAHKALAVNLSDLAAMSALPAWYFLALTLPAANTQWIDDFADGLVKLTGEHNVALAGGDLSRGALSVTITALGWVEAGCALKRSGAQASDLVVVSGQPGRAARALRCLQAGHAANAVDLKALEFPEPRVGLGRELQGLATACIDISDGLAADLCHILQQSSVGASIDVSKLPDGLAGEVELQLAGGDDYELCFTVAPADRDRLESVARSSGIELTVIGEVTQAPGLEVIDCTTGREFSEFIGYQHFGHDGTKKNE